LETNSKETNEETITISLKEYRTLRDSADILNALECGGVDSWEGYELSLEEYYDQDEE
jgi:hypothetical protein